MARLKICGLTRLEDAELAAELGAEALGFIFYEKSPRAVKPQEVRLFLDSLRPRYPQLQAVGVFVNHSADAIREIMQQTGLDIAQLHGDESPAIAEDLKDLRLWKVFRIAKDADWQVMAAWENSVEAFLFDTGLAGQFGGTGQSFDWEILKAYPWNKPFWLSGGLNPDNLSRALQEVAAYGYDLSSGLEERPGLKDHAKLKSLFKVNEASDANRTR